MQYDFEQIRQHLQERSTPVHLQDNVGVFQKVKQMVPEYVSQNFGLLSFNLPRGRE